MERIAELKCTETGWRVICKANGIVMADFFQPFVVIFGKDWPLLIAKAIANRWIDLAELQLSPAPVLSQEDYMCYVDEKLQALRDGLSASCAIGTERLQ